MWFVLAHAAHAQSCDAAALKTQLVEASPAAAGDKYAELAACDPAAAKAAAPDAFTRVIAGPGGDKAALAAVKAGAGESVRTWIVALEPDDRGGTLSRLGDACTTPEVSTFFIDAAAALGEKFYSDRWWVALDTCRTEPVQALLAGAVTARRKDRALYGGLLDTYARNRGKAGVPLLVELANKEQDPMVLVDIVDAFPAAAGVGDPAGPKPEDITAATTALRELAPRLPDNVADAARKAFLALGDEQGADSLASVRHRGLLQPQGGLLYGVVAVEVATCKKGDTRVVVHHAQLSESGDTWPDQLAERADPHARTTFDMDLAETCKGTGTISLRFPEQPLKDVSAYKSWVDSELTRVQKENASVNVKVFPYDPLSI